MKTSILSILLISLASGLSGQQRDLNYFLENAKANSPLINKSKNENKLVSLDLKQMNSVLYKPEINLVSGVYFAPIVSHDNNSDQFEFVSDGATSYNGYDLAVTEGGQYQALVSVKQPLLAGSKYKTYSDKAGISGQINDNNIALTIHELEQVVRYQYILCIKSKLLANNSLTLLNELQGHLKIMQKLAENAVYKQTDLMILQIEVQNYEVEYKTFEYEYLNSIYDLNLICGINDTSRADLKDIDLTINTVNPGTSNFLTSYRLDSLNILADQAISELKYKPQLDLFADAGLNAVYLPAFNRLGFSTGLSFTLNIFDGRQRGIQREKSAINLQTIEFEKNKFMTRNEINKNKVLDQIYSTDQRITIFEQQIRKYDELKATYSRELSLGEVSVMDFKNLLRDVSAKTQEILLLKMERQILINSYNYLNY